METYLVDGLASNCTVDFTKDKPESCPKQIISFVSCDSAKDSFLFIRLTCISYLCNIMIYTDYTKFYGFGYFVHMTMDLYFSIKYYLGIFFFFFYIKILKLYFIQYIGLLIVLLMTVIL